MQTTCFFKLLIIYSNTSLHEAPIAVRLRSKTFYHFCKAKCSRSLYFVIKN